MDSRIEEVKKEIERRNKIKEIQAELSRRQIAPKNQSFAEKALSYAANNPLTNFTLGAGDALRNLPLQIADLLPGVNTKEYQKPSSEGSAYSTGKIAGDIASFLGGGEALQGIRGLGLASKSPDLVKLAQLAGKTPALNRVAGGAALGSITNPEDRAQGALLGGGLSGLVESPALLKYLKGGGVPVTPKQFIESFQPKKAGNELIESLGKGAKNKEELSSSIVNDIKKGHSMREEEALAHMKYPLERAGKEVIYEHIDPLITTTLDKSKPLFDKLEDLNLSGLYGKFKKNPTFENAHKLQSELGVLVGDLSKNLQKGTREFEELKEIKNVRDTLKNHIHDFLEKRDATSNENLLKPYKLGSDLYRENVAPYLSSNKLRQIVREGKTVIPNAHKIFAYPANILEKSGELKMGPINKILEDLPSETRDKILLSAIGGTKHINNPNKLVKSIRSAINEGYSKYAPENIDEIIKGIEKKQGKLNTLKKLSTGLGIGSIGAAGLGTAASLLYNRGKGE